MVVVDRQGRAAAAAGERVWSSRIEYMGYCRRGMATHGKAWQAKKLIPDVTMSLCHARAGHLGRQHAHARSEPLSIISLGRCCLHKTRTNRWSFWHGPISSPAGPAARTLELALLSSPRPPVKGPQGICLYGTRRRTGDLVCYPRSWDGDGRVVSLLDSSMVSTPGV